MALGDYYSYNTGLLIYSHNISSYSHNTPIVLKLLYLERCGNMSHFDTKDDPVRLSIKIYNILMVSLPLISLTFVDKKYQIFVLLLSIHRTMSDGESVKHYQIMARILESGLTLILG